MLESRFEALSGLAVDPTGNVRVARPESCPDVFAVDEHFLDACSDQGTQQQPIQFGDAVAIAASKGRIFVVDAGANQIIGLTSRCDEKTFMRVDVTEEFPFLFTKMSPYYDR